MGVREFDDIVFIFDSDTSALSRTESLIMAGENKRMDTQTLHADGRGNKRNLFDVAHPIVRMIAAGIKKKKARWTYKRKCRPVHGPPFSIIIYDNLHRVLYTSFLRMRLIKGPSFIELYSVNFLRFHTYQRKYLANSTYACA